MTDKPQDELDAVLRVAARDYNRPGDAPRDAMWARIEARRAEQRRSTPVVPLLAARRRWLAAALAAAAVLVAGIAIGRLYERWMRPATSPALASASVARESTAVRPDDSTRARSTPVAVPLPDAVASTESQSSPRTRPSASPRAVDRAQPESRTPQLSRDLGRASPGAAEGAPNLAYRLAVLEHLAGAEAMLTSFRTAAKRGDVDAQITAWARKLLTTTQLLQASAAQQDPTMKRLLDDLELVLVQIAQYTSTGTHSAEELDLIEHSIERRGVIGKLRTTIPARLTPAGT